MIAENDIGNTHGKSATGARSFMPEESQNVTNWRYWRCPLVTPADQFGPFSNIVEMWREKVPLDCPVPSRAALDFFDFKGWWGKVAIARFEQDPFDVRFVLWGTMLTNWWGVDYTNKLLGAASLWPEVWKSVEGSYFKSMVDEPFIGVVSGYLDQHKKPHIKVIGVDLPLGEKSGLTHVITVHQEVDSEQSPETLMPDCPLIECV